LPGNIKNAFTNLPKLNPSSETNSPEANREILLILQIGGCCMFVLNQVKSGHALPFYFFTILGRRFYKVV
jgi:hypothetical protein